jgi:hypothetical protein
MSLNFHPMAGEVGDRCHCCGWRFIRWAGMRAGRGAGFWMKKFVGHRRSSVLRADVKNASRGGGV